MAYKTRVKFFAKLLIEFYANADISGQDKSFTVVLFECKSAPKPPSVHTEMTRLCTSNCTTMLREALACSIEIVHRK